VKIKAMIFTMKFIACAALVLFLPCVIQAQEAIALKDIKISFKLDQRLTRSQYMGDIWVSPLSYVGTSGQNIVEARAQGIDLKGKPIPIIAEWTPSDPEMVTVSAGQGQDVKLTILHEGESKLKVTSIDFSKELLIKAYNKNNAIKVVISRVLDTSAEEDAGTEQNSPNEE
jgi:hypothetical protein